MNSAPTSFQSEKSGCLPELTPHTKQYSHLIHSFPTNNSPHTFLQPISPTYELTKVVKKQHSKGLRRLKVYPKKFPGL